MQRKGGSGMSVLFKGFLAVLMIIGMPIALYGGWQIVSTMQFVKGSSGRASAEFVGYHREIHKTRNITTSKSVDRSYTSYSTASYPEFMYRDNEGHERTILERKVHIIELYKPGDKVEILLSSHDEPRMAGFYSLYARDALILALGLGFILFPLFFWKIVSVTAGQEQVEKEISGSFHRLYSIIAELKIGPVPFRYILVGFGGFMLVGLLLGVIGGLAPFVKQMRFGSGGRLLTALEEKRFEDARVMISEGSGINAKNEFDQTPLLIALETGQYDLARKLIEAGVDVNVKSKMLMTPLRVATVAGELDMVMLLLARGASPDVPEDEFPPFAYALAKKRYDIARVLIEGGTDLHRRYPIGSRTGTVGDMAVLAKQQDLADIIRERGGSFSE